MFEWVQEYDTVDGNGQSDNTPEGLREAYRKSINDAVTLIREGREEVLERIIQEEVKEEDWKERIEDEIRERTFAYTNLKSLRDLLPDNDIIVKALISDILEVQIIRRDIHFSERYAKYKIASEEELVNITIAIIGLTRFYVLNRYTQDCICEDFIEETRLPQEIAEEYAEIIEQHYREMQIVMLIDKLANKEV